MKLSKGNLYAVEMTKEDKNIPALDNVHITKEGATIATNGLAVLAVSPVSDYMKKKVPGNDREMLTNETVSSETIKEIIKNIPRDTKFKGILEHCDYANGTFDLADLKRKRSISAKTYPREYVNYKDVLVNARKKINKVKCAVNLKRMLSILNTIDKICPDTSKNSAVFLEFTEDNNIFFRCQNVATEQKVIAYMKAYDTSEMAWPELDNWERDLLGVKPLRKIKKMKITKSLNDVNLALKKRSEKEKERFEKWKIKKKQEIRKGKK